MSNAEVEIWLEQDRQLKKNKMKDESTINKLYIVKDTADNLHQKIDTIVVQGEKTIDYFTTMKNTSFEKTMRQKDLLTQRFELYRMKFEADIQKLEEDHQRVIVHADSMIQDATKNIVMKKAQVETKLKRKIDILERKSKDIKTVSFQNIVKKEIFEVQEEVEEVEEVKEVKEVKKIAKKEVKKPTNRVIIPLPPACEENLSAPFSAVERLKQIEKVATIHTELTIFDNYTYNLKKKWEDPTNELDKEDIAECIKEREEERNLLVSRFESTGSFY